MAADPKSVSVEELKSAFKEGATPNEENYHNLIDLAAVGGKALGGGHSDPTKLSPGEGLQMAAGKLVVKVKKDAGVTLDGDGVAVKGDGKTVTVTADGVGIKVKANGGLESNTGGLQVKAGPGLKTDKDGLEIKLAEKGGLKAELGGLAVYTGAGLEIDANGALTVKAKSGEGNYITSTPDGLAITKEGIGKIKEALESATLGALEKAVAGTNKGYKAYSNKSGKEEVEHKIAGKLNEAFTEGWQLKLPREALFHALKDISGQGLDSSSIGPSSVSGMTGLYALDGTEYTPEQILAFKVSSSGTVEPTKWESTQDGIYAILGKVNDKGVPSTSGSLHTKIALMVTVENKNRTVIGHWDLMRLEEGTNGWSSTPCRDGVAEQTLTKAVEAEKKNAETQLNTLKTAHGNALKTLQLEAQKNKINFAMDPGQGEAKCGGYRYPIRVRPVNQDITALSINVYNTGFESLVSIKGTERKGDLTEFELRLPIEITMFGHGPTEFTSDREWPKWDSDPHGSLSCRYHNHGTYGDRETYEERRFTDLKTNYMEQEKQLQIICKNSGMLFDDRTQGQIWLSDPRFGFVTGDSILAKVNILDCSVWLNIFSQKE